jgi:ABC-type transport system involved in multi-copper enzyme maturation permease subunit
MSGKKKIETKRAGLLKALIYGVASVIFYVLVFMNADHILSILFSKTIKAPLLSMSLALLASGLYGTCTSKLLKHTLEKALKSQQLREE